LQQSNYYCLVIEPVSSKPFDESLVVVILPQVR